jgi:C1A family cysteine protease
MGGQIFMKKIIVILVLTLLIGTMFLPLVSSTNKNNNNFLMLDDVFNDQDCKCYSEYSYIKEFSIMTEPLMSYYTDEGNNMQIMNNLPDYFNWKDFNGQDWTTPAKSQGFCGSCWDFAALGALESVINIKENISDLNPDLSEQYVLSCLPAAANRHGQGCLGGNPWKTYKFIHANDSRGNDCNGIILESCMPYQANHNIPCEEKCEDWENYLVPITNYGQNWWLNHEESTLDLIKTRIIEGGPVAAGINVSDDFSNWGYINHDPLDYYPDPHENYSNYINHVIVIVGWKDEESIGNGGYWTCKNSWGETFGYDGFFNIEYGALFTGWFTAWVEYNPDDYDRPPVPKSNGPYYGLTNEEIQFSGDAVGENPPFTYHWDFGDGSTSTEQNPIHTYESTGEYSVILTVMDDDGVSLTDETFTWIQDTNQPPSTPIIDGPSQINKGDYCWYNITFNDPDGTPVYLYAHAFGLESGIWWGPYPDGYGIQNIYHYWEEEGDYIVKAKAKDPYGIESDWAILNVTVSKIKSITDFNPWLFRLIQRFPILDSIL